MAKKILVVEDSREERMKAEEILVGAGHVFALAEDLHAAMLHLTGWDIVENKPVGEKIDFDGVITDLIYPRLTGEMGEEAPYGLRMVVYCSKNNIPCVVCTELGSHKSIFRCLKEVIEELGTKVVGNKDWQQALDFLLQEIAKKD